MTQSVAGVLLRDGELLLARRKTGGDMGGRWELPGGKCEGAEGPVAALIREFDEEFSLLISVGEACAEASFRHHGKEHRVRAYYIDTEGNFDKLAEHDQVAWFGLKNLPPRASIVDSDAELLDQLARHGR